MPELERAPPAHDEQTLSYAVASVTMTGRRRDNEDSCLAVTFSSPADGPMAALAVADGMGGLPGGEVASELAIGCLREHLVDFQKGKWSDVRGMLASAVAAGHTAVRAHGSGDESARHLGTTLTVALIRGGGAVVAHVGDTRVYVIQGETIRQLTHDHNIIQDMVDRELYTWERICRNANLRINALTRCIGDEEQPVVDFVPVEPELRIELDPGMILFSCSDGLTGLVEGPDKVASPAVSDQEILENLTGTDDLEAACKELVFLAYERGSPDNITVGALRVQRADEAPQALTGLGTNKSGKTGGAPLDRVLRGVRATLRLPVGRAVARAFDFRSVPVLVGWVVLALIACIALALQLWGVPWKTGDAAESTRAAEPPRSPGDARRPVGPVVEIRDSLRDLTPLGSITFSARGANGDTVQVDRVRLSFFGYDVPPEAAVAKSSPGSSSYSISVGPVVDHILANEPSAELKNGNVRVSCTIAGREVSSREAWATLAAQAWEDVFRRARGGDQE